jgi:transcriptional regulator of NAD metabolism
LLSHTRNRQFYADRIIARQEEKNEQQGQLEAMASEIIRLQNQLHEYEVVLSKTCADPTLTWDDAAG